MLGRRLRKSRHSAAFNPEEARDPVSRFAKLQSFFAKITHRSRSRPASMVSPSAPITPTSSEGGIYALSELSAPPDYTNIPDGRPKRLSWNLIIEARRRAEAEQEAFERRRDAIIREFDATYGKALSS